MKFVFVFTLFMLLGAMLGGVAAQMKAPPFIGDDCTCHFAPKETVCGTNGKTYPSFCELQCERTGWKHDGACP
ncbi:kazal-type serine protease inhibitor domain-containing protein [Phthorimaea operculella]|nr:kazal-type serine protease inhibitor domain-containing protein [Phthorimaea operculella]